MCQGIVVTLKVNVKLHGHASEKEVRSHGLLNVAPSNCLALRSEDPKCGGLQSIRQKMAVQHHTHEAHPDASEKTTDLCFLTIVSI